MRERDAGGADGRVGEADGRAGELDELRGGSEPESGSPRRRLPAKARGVLAPVAVFAVLALVVVALGSGHRGPTPRPTPTGTLGRDALPDLVVDGLCTALTQGDSQLLLTFRLLNRGAEKVVLDDVEPSLPLGGLRPIEVGYTTGDCLRSVQAGPGIELDADEGVRVTFLLALPAGCAAPYPVAASVDAHTARRSSRETLAVLPDLGSVALPGCAIT